MSSSSTQSFSIRRKVLAAVAALTAAVGVSVAAAGVASAATPECGWNCISVFSSELGTQADPNFVEAILGDGTAKVGQPVGLKPVNRFDPTQDIQPFLQKVSDFYAMGLVSAATNSHYGNQDAVQQRYAPYGVATDLCVGLAKVAYENEGLTLQPCTSRTTVWIILPSLSPSTPGLFPIVNGTTTDYKHPFAMHLPRSEVVSGKPLQMVARRLTFLGKDKTLPARQLWGVHPGVLPE